MRTSLLLCAGAAVLGMACEGGDDPGTDAGDADAEAAPATPLGKADAASLDGLYATATTSLRAGDVPTVQFLPDGAYVRARCYHARCGLEVAETDHYDVVKSKGHTYVRFWSFTIAVDAAGDRTPTPVLADVYELRHVAQGIKLRKTYTSRWLTLDAASQTDLCDATGGAWSNATCACPGAGPLDDNHGGFVAGAGGCVEIPGGGESACDDSGGLYTDDETTPVGTYCECGLGRYVAPGPGACARI